MIMKPLSKPLSYIIGLFALACSVAFAGTNSELNVGNRTSIIYAPSNYNNPALVISMHGMGLGTWWTPGAMQFEAIADTANFIVAYPQGVNSRWDIGGDTDVQFILAIIDSMANRYQIDRNRVYATGFSMGGMMSWHLACKIPDKIAAIVPGNGYPLGGMSGCSEERYVPALQIHGTADDFVSYSGFVNSFLPSQISRYGCPTSAIKTMPYPTETNGRNAEQLAQPSKSFLEYYGPCSKDGKTSELYLLSVDGMIHDWATPNRANTNEDPNYTGKPLDVNGTWEAWNWMKTRSLQGDIPVLTVPTARDSVFNGDFTQGPQGALGWTFNTWGGSASGTVENEEYKMEITETGTENSSIQLIQNGIVLQQGQHYQIQFDARANTNRTLEVNVELDVSPWTSYLSQITQFDLTTSTTQYTLPFTMSQPTDSNSRIAFNAGAATGTIYIDNVTIAQVEAPTKTHTRNTPTLTINQTAHTLQLSLTATQHQPYAITVFDLWGRPVQQTTVPSNHPGHIMWSTDYSKWPAGVYLIRIAGGDKSSESLMIYIAH
jgi:poly(3-hydroxybutyrate) depolymerase